MGSYVLVPTQSLELTYPPIPGKHTSSPARKIPTPVTYHTGSRSAFQTLAALIGIGVMGSRDMCARVGCLLSNLNGAQKGEELE